MLKLKFNFQVYINRNTYQQKKHYSLSEQKLLSDFEVKKAVSSKDCDMSKKKNSKKKVIQSEEAKKSMKNFMKHHDKVITQPKNHQVT